MIRSRRAFLRGRYGEAAEPLRPPWVDEEIFVKDCTACGECLAACPEGILLRGEGGLPTVDFERGECTFCKACAESCPEDLFDTTASRPWTYRAAIASHCLAQKGVMCRTCGDSCDARAIAFPWEAGKVPLPRVDTAACTGCGACLSVCPVDAVSMERGAAAREAGHAA